jgi:hypothetical protein
MESKHPIYKKTAPGFFSLFSLFAGQIRRNCRSSLAFRAKKLLLTAIFFVTFVITSWGQTTFTLNLGANSNWTTAGWVKTGTVTAATYPGQVGGETHIV